MALSFDEGSGVPGAYREPIGPRCHGTFCRLEGGVLISQNSVLPQIAGFTLMWRHVMTEQNIGDITSVDPNDLLFRIYSGQVAKGLTRRQRQLVFAQWKVVQHAFEEYAERLSAGQRDILGRFFVKPLTSRLKLLQARAWASYNQEQQARAK